MASRQFSLVVFRALAVYVAIVSLSQLHQLAFFIFGFEGAPDGFNGATTHKIISLCILTFQVLLATILWTNADKFAGNDPDVQPTIRAGNWMVRLVFTALGILICVFSIDNFIDVIGRVLVPDPYRRETSRYEILNAITEAIRFFIGLGIFLAYRFDKRAALQAAQAIEPS